MIFKDRREAGEKLAKTLYKRKMKTAVVVSLLRGGVIIGQEISKKLRILHLPLAVAKIPAPFQSELAIGALCFDFVYLDKKIIESLNIDKYSIRKQITIAKEKFASYLKKFKLNKSIYKKLKNKIVVLTDDGIATGSTVKAALLFIRSFMPKKIILALPVGPNDFEIIGFNDLVILHRDANFSSVSQFYKDFPQMEDEEILRLLRYRSQ